VPLLEQEMVTLSEHPSSPPVFSGVPVAWSIVLASIISDSFYGQQKFTILSDNAPLTITISLMEETDHQPHKFLIFCESAFSRR
jgi:hypothetical protein